MSGGMVAQLAEMASQYEAGSAPSTLLRDAADEIERLRADVDSLTEMVADAVPKLVNRLQLMKHAADLQAELAAPKTPCVNCLKAGHL